MTHLTAASPLRIELVEGDGTRIVRLTGELDLVSADAVRSAVVHAGGPTVVVDLSGLEFIDSSGLSALLTARRQLTSTGHRLVLSGAKGAARRAFEVSGLDDVLEPGPSVD
jgi:anti-sigma B factor antagonist